MMGVRNDENEVLDDEVQDESAETEATEDESSETESADSGTDSNEQTGADDASSDTDEVVVSIGEKSSEEAEQERAPEWVRDLRKANREKDRRIRELEQTLTSTTQPMVAAVGEKPTFAGCDYDEDKFTAELEAWNARKQQAEEQKRQAEQAEENGRKSWQAKLDAYGKAKADLKVNDFEDAEATAQEVFSVIQQGVILNGADNPATLVYALGKHPAKAKELAAITDPVKFAFAVAKLETQLKVTPRKSAPMPEKVVRGSAPVSGSVDSNLERLRAEAERTGDYTKVTQYKQQQRAKQK